MKIAITREWLESALKSGEEPGGLMACDPDLLRACNCIGPQNGQPLCPCQMRGVQIKDGRYVRVQDLGPAP